MSYFLGGLNVDSSVMNKFVDIFEDILPTHIRNDIFRFESGSSCLIMYGNKKAIPNITIQDYNQDSWLVLVGTPLVNIKSKEEQQELLREFLRNPADELQNKIDGNFAVFAYDASTNNLIAATDYNNTTPIYYAVTSNGIIFSSHELVLAKHLYSKIDPFGFSQIINLGVTWNSHTRFQNIHKMLPCQIVRFGNDKDLYKEQYWRPHNEKQWTGNFDGYIEKWITLLKDAVWKFYECSDHKPAVADFTAGEDSRLIIALCHALRIPFKAHVTGLSDDIDVIVAKKAARNVDIDLIERRKHWISKEQLISKASNLSLDSDAYQELFALCAEYATDTAEPLDDYGIVKYCGVPGGEAFRGSYYLRGKASFPSRRSKLDYKFFTKMKYLLDYHPGLLRYSDSDFIQAIHEMAKDALEEVKAFPIGIQIDHMLRVFQTCCTGLKYKNPLYLPFATNQMTRSIYSIPPRYKAGGRLSKACTEILFPELAVVRTQYGVPTIRKTILRTSLFFPEYIAVVKKIISGSISRLLKWKQANKWYYSHDRNAYIFTALLNTQPYCDWFSSSRTMVTGHLYNANTIDPILEKAKTGSCRYVPILGRAIVQELALRWVYREGLS